MSREIPLASVLAILLTLPLAILISPFYEVPLTDDWAYRAAVAKFLEQGRFVDLGWGDPTLVFQVLWGGLFASILGPSYGVLRLSTLCLFPMAWVAAYYIMRRLALGPLVAGTSAAILVFQPISLQLAYSFNTDFPYFALATLATALLVRAYTSPSRSAWLLSGIAIGLAFLVRQTAIFLAPVGLLALSVPQVRAASGNRRVSALAVIGPVALAVLVAALMAPRALDAGSLTNGPLSESVPAMDLLLRATREGVGAILTLALLSLPLLLGGSVRRTSKTRFLVGLVLGFACAGIVFLLGPWLGEEQTGFQRGWPYQGNLLSRQAAVAHQPGVRIASPKIWTLLTVAVPILAGWWTSRALSFPRTIAGGLRSRDGLEGDARVMGLVVLAGVVQFVPFLFAQSFYDRYLVNALLAALLLVAHPLRGVVPPWRKAVLLFTTLCLVALSVEWTRFQVDRARAVWTVANELVATGVPVENIYAGFEWNGHHHYLRALDELHLEPPFDMEAGFPWDPLVGPFTYSVAELRGEPQGDRIVASYRGFLRRSASHVGARLRTGPPSE